MSVGIMPTTTSIAAREARKIGGTIASTMIVNDAIRIYLSRSGVALHPEEIALMFTVGNLANLALGTAARDLKHVLENSPHSKKVWMIPVMVPVNFLAAIFG